jgi:iron complex outermembrane recepter protein
MMKLNKRGRLRYLISACLATSVAMPLVAQAQDDVDVEEVVVTGSYIRNSAFTQDSNVDTVSQEDLFESGAPSMTNYIRELTYVQNVNAVSNVLGSSDGTQSSVGGSFNLRGLGENSTLQLVDGVRTIDQSLNNMLPDLAIERLEVVLDGGSALYGSDAVAGVVNLVPIKDFEGFRTRTYYQVDEEGGFEDMRASLLWGRSFDNGISYVGAFDAKTTTPLMQEERPREWTKDNGSSSSGNPGAWRQIVDADPTLNLYDFHGGNDDPRNTSTVSNILDPSCETFNDGAPGHGEAKFNTPSGVITGSATNPICRFEYTKQFQYNRESTDYLFYNTFSYEPADWLRLNFTHNYSYRITDGRTTSTTATSTNNRRVLLMREDHPANPFGFDVSPWNYRLITEMYTNRPSHLSDSTGSRGFETHTMNNRATFRADFDLAGSWTGYSYVMGSQRKDMSDDHAIHLGKLQLAFNGQGGPGGDQYWNPLGSADPRSPHYVEGVTSNSQQITDWLFAHDYNALNSRDELDIFELGIQGEVIELPAGVVQMAVGIQNRNVTESDFADKLDILGHDYNTSVGANLPTDTEFYSEVNAVYMEIEVPILETVDMQLAVRHEEFKDFGLDATTPKVALRWEVMPNLALRASWGESFLAPTPTQARPFLRSENCLESFSGTDDFTGLTMTGTTRCESGNPNLAPETSEIVNFGFTWQGAGALDGLELSADYQEIEYTDRIRTLTEQDTVRFEFTKMLAATGISESAYDSTPGSATRAQAEAWYAVTATTAGNPVDRFVNFELDRTYRQAANISSVWIDLFDVKASYDIDTDGWGSFRTTLQTTMFSKYEYEGLTGGVVDALGKQNDGSGIVPPLPEWKTNLRVNWFMGNHSASLSANYWSDVKWDGRVYDNYKDGWTAPPGNTIESETRVNVRYAFVFDDLFNSEITASAGVTNLFDRRPQRLPMIGGFESRLSTPWGRQFWVSVDWTPGG